MFKYRRVIKLKRSNFVTSNSVKEYLYKTIKEDYKDAFVKENIVGFNISSFFYFGINRGAQGRILIQDMDTYMYIVFQMKNSQQPGLLIFCYLIGLFAIFLGFFNEVNVNIIPFILILSVTFITILLILWLGFKASSISIMGYIENKLFEELKQKN